ncbi:MAG: hypothetical protein AAGJ29_13485 [Pseudomonadota bacterium]
MTANGTANTAFDPISAIGAGVYRGWRLMVRVFLGGLFVIGAGIVALATAMLGLLIALAALILRYSGAATVQVRTARARREPTSDPDTITLDARRTARGWTVE